MRGGRRPCPRWLWRNSSFVPTSSGPRAVAAIESTKKGIWVYYSLREDLPGAVLDLLAALVEPLVQATKAGLRGACSPTLRATGEAILLSIRLGEDSIAEIG